MTYSLQVSNGDLVAQTGQLSTVTGSQKLLQDLALWVLTRMGSDQYNTGYGSLVDGGITPTGNIVPSPIGGSTWSVTQNAIQQDLTRIVSAYQAAQNARMQADLAQFGKSTLTNDEICTGISDIDFSVNIDVLTVNVAVTNASNNQVSFSIPIQGSVI